MTAQVPALPREAPDPIREKKGWRKPRSVPGALLQLMTPMGPAAPTPGPQRHWRKPQPHPALRASCVLMVGMTRPFSPRPQTRPRGCSRSRSAMFSLCAALLRPILADKWGNRGPELSGTRSWGRSVVGQVEATPAVLGVFWSLLLGVPPCTLCPTRPHRNAAGAGHQEATQPRHGHRCEDAHT